MGKSSGWELLSPPSPDGSGGWGTPPGFWVYFQELKQKVKKFTKDKKVCFSKSASCPPLAQGGAAEGGGRKNLNFRAIFFFFALAGGLEGAPHALSINPRPF